MADWVMWLVAAGVLVALELFSGTFYLLMIAIGALAGAEEQVFAIGAPRHRVGVGVGHEAKRSPRDAVGAERDRRPGDLFGIRNLDDVCRLVAHHGARWRTEYVRDREQRPADRGAAHEGSAYGRPADRGPTDGGLPLQVCRIILSTRRSCGGSWSTPSATRRSGSIDWWRACSPSRVPRNPKYLRKDPRPGPRLRDRRPAHPPRDTWQAVAVPKLRRVEPHDHAEVLALTDLTLTNCAPMTAENAVTKSRPESSISSSSVSAVRAIAPCHSV